MTRLHAVTSATTKTHCPYCAFQCGLAMTVQDAGPDDVAVVADEDFPVNRGQICVKGATSAALLAHPARLRAPMLRQENGKLAPVTSERSRLRQRRQRRQSARFRAARGAREHRRLRRRVRIDERESVPARSKFVRVVLRSPNID